MPGFAGAPDVTPRRDRRRQQREHGRHAGGELLAFLDADCQAPNNCDFHMHTTWSDGALSLRELVDLYGRTGDFDVIAISDHILREKDWRRSAGAPSPSPKRLSRPISTRFVRRRSGRGGSTSCW